MLFLTTYVSLPLERHVTHTSFNGIPLVTLFTNTAFPHWPTEHSWDLSWLTLSLFMSNDRTCSTSGQQNLEHSFTSLKCKCLKKEESIGQIRLIIFL